jgi:hypothetical protein
MELGSGRVRLVSDAGAQHETTRAQTTNAKSDLVAGAQALLGFYNMSYFKAPEGAPCFSVILFALTDFPLT